MKKLAIALCALSLVVLTSMPVLAEVQNIKVSGDITMRGFYRDNYSTVGSGGGRLLTGFTNTESRDWYNTITKLGVDADLTDNVVASLLMANERDWGINAATDFNVQLYCGYVTMKEMLYSPLTIKAGRMPVQIADGLVVGDGVTNENYLGSDYSAKRAFDTIYGILDFDPLTIITGTVKATDAPQSTTDDVDAYLLDTIYKFNVLKATLDTYLVNIHYNTPRTLTGPSGTSTKGLNLWDLSTRLTMEPAAGLNLDLGLAYQFGDYAKTATTSRDLKAWASNLGINYALNVAMNPKLGAKYIYRSGNNNTGANDEYKGWLPLFTNQVNGVIYNPNTNISALDFNAGIMPLDKLTLSADLWLYNLAKKQPDSATTSEKKGAGTELDLAAKYAYTEDVSLGLSLAYFFPGDYYKDGNDKTAKQAMLELGVKF